MVVQTFEITLDNNEGIYYSGETISGKVYVKLSNWETIRGIVLTFRGEGLFKWPENKKQTFNDGTKRNVGDDYWGREMYLDNNLYVFGSPTEGMFLHPGEYETTFKLKLPDNLPPTFEHAQGGIHYSIIGTLDGSSTKTKVKVNFIITQDVDLTLQKHLKEPSRNISERLLNCCWLLGGHVKVITNLPMSGFAPGQVIIFTVNVDNFSNVHILSVNCLLQQMMIFHAKIPKRKTLTLTRKVCHTPLGSLEPDMTHMWKGHLTVPSLPPSGLDHCGIMDVQYCFTVKLKFSYWFRRLYSVMPIVIGTHPLETTPIKPKISSKSPERPKHGDMDISAMSDFSECIEVTLGD